MLWNTAVNLFTLWLVGVLMSQTFGGYLHILVGVTLVVAVIQLIRRRNDLVRLRKLYAEG